MTVGGLYVLLKRLDFVFNFVLFKFAVFNSSFFYSSRKICNKSELTSYLHLAGADPAYFCGL